MGEEEEQQDVEKDFYLYSVSQEGVSNDDQYSSNSNSISSSNDCFDTWEINESLMEFSHGDGEERRKQPHPKNNDTSFSRKVIERFRRATVSISVLHKCIPYKEY